MERMRDPGWPPYSREQHRLIFGHDYFHRQEQRTGDYMTVITAIYSFAPKGAIISKTIVLNCDCHAVPSDHNRTGVHGVASTR
jgi:hypothetical protein